MKILLIETATRVCSAAMAVDGTVTMLRECADADAHSTRLPLFLKEITDAQRPDAVCVSAGPGSYTGLRIGVSSAKGLCYGYGIPLLSVPTLLSMAALYYAQHPEYHGLVCTMIDARRMECYTMVVDRGLNILRDTQAEVIAEDCYDQWLDRGEMMFIGDGAAKTRPLLGGHPNARYDEGFSISATGMAGLAEQRLAAGKVEDVAYFEPFYLKDFVAKKSVVHGLR